MVPQESLERASRELRMHGYGQSYNTDLFFGLVTSNMMLLVLTLFDFTLTVLDIVI